jgi:putative oxidoreductase
VATKIEGLTDGEKPVSIGLRTPPGIFARAWDQRFASLRGADWERLLIGLLHRWSIPALRVGLGLVFLWFGVLKLLGSSPIAAMVRQSYPFLPFFVALGGWEVLIGCGLICKRALRSTLVLLLLHMTGTLIALGQAPSLFFLKGNPLLLTMEGEFVMKNVVLITASLVIGGYEINPRSDG